MQLLFKREQTGRTFKMWAKLECNEEEQALIDKYKMDGTALIVVIQPTLLRNSFFIGCLVAALVFPFLPAIGMDIGPDGVKVAILFGIVAGYIYFNQKRETIMVKDLLHGRFFNCKSVVELARKEAWLEQISTYFRQVLESAKHWDGTETRDIEALPPQEAKRMILSGPIM